MFTPRPKCVFSCLFIALTALSVNAYACPVTVDCVPGAYPNRVCLGTGGIIPVGVFSPSAEAFAYADPSTALAADSWANLPSGASPIAWDWQDLNDDGILDLLLEFSVTDMVALGVLQETTNRIYIQVSGDWHLNANDFCRYDHVRGASSLLLTPSGSIGEWVWQDLNADGVQDADEPGIPEVTVNLYDNAGNILDSQTTDSDGFYLFEGLCPDTYMVQVDVATLPAGLSPTPTTAIPDVELDSNENPAVVELTEDVLDDWSVDFGFMGCGDCAGKVNSLTLRYLGDVEDANVVITMAKGCQRGPVVFNGTVQPGEAFSFVGADKWGTFGPQLTVTVNGVRNAEIHTSCSRPIGPNMAFGDFKVLAGSSLNGGALCPVADGGSECGPCEGKVSQLTLQYLGSKKNASIVVATRRDGIAFRGTVQPGETFSFNGTDKMGTLGTEIYLFVNGCWNTSIHTSCSQPIGPDMTFGAFKVVSGESREGGALCPVDSAWKDECHKVMTCWKKFWFKKTCSGGGHPYGHGWSHHGRHGKKCGR